MLPVNKNLQNFSPLTYIPGCGKRTSSLQFGNKFLRKEAHLVFTVKSLEAVKPGKRARVERGLYVEVSKDGTSRRFLFRFVSPATHRPTEAGLGTWPTVSLADARLKAADMRSAVAKGIDPIHAKREDRAQKREQEKASKTLSDALDAYTKAFESKRAPTVELDALVRRHVATLLPRPLATITSDDVLISLAPTQAKLPKTAARARAAVSTLFDYAVAKGMFNGANPARASVFRYLLPAAPKSVPHRMMPFAEVPAFFARLSEASSPSRLCLAFLILTAARSQEAIKATWDEIDMGSGLWVVPAERMKKRRLHKVPLSSQALDVLHEARDMFEAGKFVFPGLTKGSPLNSRALQTVVQKQLREPYAVHGFRASFSTWAHERTDVPHELIELALAHIEGQGNSVVRAYNRSDAIERRRALMQAWGDFVTGAQVSNVVPFPAATRP
jgi:integrase